MERVILYSETVTVPHVGRPRSASPRPAGAGDRVGRAGSRAARNALAVEVRALPDAPREDLAPGGGMRVIVAGEGWG